MRTAIPFSMLTFLAACLLSTSSLGAEFYVIAYKDVPDKTLDETALRNIYLGQKAQWSDNSTVYPGRYLKGGLNDEFVRQVTGKSTTAFRIYWKRLIFTGQIEPFADLDSEEEMIKWVGQTAGAIGYVGSKPDSPNVKVLYHGLVAQEQKPSAESTK